MLGGLQTASANEAVGVVETRDQWCEGGRQVAQRGCDDPGHVEWPRDRPICRNEFAQDHQHHGRQHDAQHQRHRLSGAIRQADGAQRALQGRRDRRLANIPINKLVTVIPSCAPDSLNVRRLTAFTAVDAPRSPPQPVQAPRCPPLSTRAQQRRTPHTRRSTRRHRATARLSHGEAHSAALLRRRQNCVGERRRRRVGQLSPHARRRDTSANARRSPPRDSKAPREGASSSPIGAGCGVLSVDKRPVTPSVARDVGTISDSPGCVTGPARPARPAVRSPRR